MAPTVARDSAQHSGARDGSPLDRFRVVRTDNVGMFIAALEKLYVKPTLYLPPGATSVDFALNVCQLPRLELGYVRYGSETCLDFPDSEGFSLKIPLTEKGELRVGSNAVGFNHQSSALVSHGMAHRLIFGADYEHILVKFFRHTLTETLTTMIDAPVQRPIEFSVSPDATLPAAQHLRGFVTCLVQQLSTQPEPFPGIVLNELEQSLLIWTLLGHRNNYSERLYRTPAPAAPWQVRRAEEFIEAHWNESITIERLTAAANSSARSLFRTFKQSRGMSPMAFAKQVRLQNARKMLHRTDATITEIALTCGFTEVSRFSKDYKRAFGASPSLERDQRAVRRANETL